MVSLSLFYSRRGSNREQNVYDSCRRRKYSLASLLGTMLIIYGSCALLYLPVAQPASLLNLDRLTLGVLLLSGLSTLISYGAFAESLAHWEASKISAVQSLTPIVTIATSWVIAAALPGILAPASLTSLGFLGALLVMGGSILIALGQRLKPAGVA